MADARITQAYIEVISTGDPTLQNVRLTQAYLEVISTGPTFIAPGAADGTATAVAFPSYQWTTGHADGFADVVAFSRDVAKAAGQADGFASADSAAGVPATGNADGFATVFSGPRPGGNAAILTAGI